METLEDIKEYIDNLEIRKAKIGGFSKEHVYIILYQLSEKYQNYIKGLCAQMELQSEQICELRDELATVRVKLPRDVEAELDRNEELGLSPLDQIREMKKLKEQNVSYIDQIVQLKGQVQEDNNLISQMKRRLESYEEQCTQMHIRNQAAQKLIQDLYAQIEETNYELEETKLILQRHKHFLVDYYTGCIDKQVEIVQNFTNEYKTIKEDLGDLGDKLTKDATQRMEFMRRAALYEIQIEKSEDPEPDSQETIDLQNQQEEDFKDEVSDCENEE